MPANAMLPKPKRLLTRADESCPAVEVIRGGEAVRCRIEHSTLGLYTDPSSIDGFCCGAYQQCPTWQREKKRIQVERLARPLVDGSRVKERAE